MQRGKIAKQSKEIAHKALAFMKAKQGITTNLEVITKLECDFLIAFLHGTEYRKDDKLEELEELKSKLDPDPLPEDIPYERAVKEVVAVIDLVKKELPLEDLLVSMGKM